jgi:2-hydroxychromene-2-carboxylate isomerase
MRSRIKLELFFDCLSPFSYLAHSTLRRYVQGGPWCDRVQIVLRPVLLAGIMSATGNTPPGARPWAAAQAKHVQQDMARNRTFFNVDMKDPPSNFFGPGGPADPAGLARNFAYMRMLNAVRARHPARLPEATRLTFDLIWRDARGPNDEVVITPAVLASLLERAGLPAADAAELVGTHLGSPANKAALKEARAEPLCPRALLCRRIAICDLGRASRRAPRRWRAAPSARRRSVSPTKYGSAATGWSRWRSTCGCRGWGQTPRVPPRERSSEIARV